MDVSIAVSLIRGQMGTVVERAVNGAVETVLAEMLRVVGVKFEELKAQVAALQRDMATAQREKALKEKENDKIKAMLRYTELKLKYYRQGVEEEIQHRASTSSYPSSRHASPSSAARSLEPPPDGETAPSSRSLSRAESESSQVSPVPQSGSRPVVRVSHQSDEGCNVTELSNRTDQSDTLPDGLLLYGCPGQEHGSDDMSFPADGDATVHEKEEDDGDWIISLQSDMESVDPSPCQAPLLAMPRSTPPVQVKEEFPTIQEVMFIKKEPEDQQVGTLLLDCQGRPARILGSEGQQSPAEFSGTSMQRSFPGHMAHGFNFPASTSSSISGSSLPALLAHVPPRQAVRPWPKDLRLYEEYKLRRNELQRRSINRRREREKNLPQPLLADLVRERREKTRLRVARWRAKRKLQAGLNQAQAQGDAVGFSQQHVRNLHTQQHMALPSGGVVPSIRALPTQATSFLGNNLMSGNNVMPGNSNMLPINSNMIPRNSNMMPNNNNNMLPGNMMPSNNMLPSNRFPAYMSSSSSVFLGRGNLAAQHAVTTTTSPQPHAGQSQHSSSLMDSHLFQ